MAELLVSARTDNALPGAYLRGQAVVVQEDGFAWGSFERLPRYVVLKFPGVSVAAASKYVARQFDPITGDTIGRRLWQVQWLELPAAARTKLASTGALTIAPSGGDYTWAQVKNFFMRLDTNAREVDDLPVSLASARAAARRATKASVKHAARAREIVDTIVDERGE